MLKICFLFIFISIVIVLFSIKSYKDTETIKNKARQDILSKNYIEAASINMDSLEPVLEKIKRVVVYEDMTIEELSAKLNKSLNSNLSNKGELIAEYAIKYNVDPYVATAIMLHETGCKWNCSYLVKACNNVGGMKGHNSCNGGSYGKFSSLNQGIKSFMENLSLNYYKKGLDTVEEINAKYSGNSKGWTKNVYKYVNEIRSK